jgi:hypothetical protein
MILDELNKPPIKRPDFYDAAGNLIKLAIGIAIGGFLGMVIVHTGNPHVGVRGVRWGFYLGAAAIVGLCEYGTSPGDGYKSSIDSSEGSMKFWFAPIIGVVMLPFLILTRVLAFCSAWRP